MSGPVASSAFTHLFGETVHTGRSCTEQSGHWLCQRRGRGSLSPGTRGNGEWCVKARNLESGQRAGALQDAHKQRYTHKRTDNNLHVHEASMHTSMHFHQRCRRVNSSYALCPFPPPVAKLLICSVLTQNIHSSLNAPHCIYCTLLTLEVLREVHHFGTCLHFTAYKDIF